MPDPLPLSTLERRVYDYLVDFLAANTYQPSVREIGRQFRIKSTKSVVEVLQSLEAKGYVEREAGRSRGLRLIGFAAPGQTRLVPLYRALNPSEPLRSEEHRERSVALDRALVPGDDAFLLRVPDDSMTGRGMQRGDLVLVNPAGRARDGDAVVARLGQDVRIRVLARRGAQLSLSAGVDGQEAILGPLDDYAVVGPVTAIIRPSPDSVTGSAVDARPET